MTKFLLGVAVGYVFSNLIDELVGKAGEVVDNSIKNSEPPTTVEDVPVT